MARGDFDFGAQITKAEGKVLRTLKLVIMKQ